MERGDKSRVFLNTAVITASAVAEKLLFFILNVIIARYLDLNQYGEYTTALAFASFFSLFTDAGINETLIRELNYEKEKEQTLFNVVLLKVVMSVLIFIIFIGVTLSSGYSREVVYLILVFGLVRFGDEYLRLYYTYYEGTERYITSAIYGLLFALCFLGTVIIVIMINGGNSEIVWSRFFVVIIFLTLMTYNISRGRYLKFDPAYIRSFIRKTFPFASSFIYSNIINQGGLIVLPLLHGTTYTGIFQNAYIFITTLMFVPASFGRAFIPYLYRHKGDTDNKRFQFAFDILTKCFVFISFYIALILFLYSGFLITGIFGEKYKDSINTLRLISLGIPFLFNSAYIILTALDKQKLYSSVLRYIAAANLVANIILGYYFRDKGTAAATVITFILIFFLSNCLIKQGSELSVRISVTGYLKGGVIFIICWMAHAYIAVNNTVISMLIISSLFFLLNFVFMFTRDDLRIAGEILRSNK